MKRLSNISRYLLHAGAGTMSPDIMSSEMTGGSLGGGGHTRESIMSSVAARITPLSSGGSVLDDLHYHVALLFTVSSFIKIPSIEIVMNEMYKYTLSLSWYIG